ncbi:MAG: T9SS type A sorting domain-containing protein [Dysgonamonadaceae bacterium]|jgi:hypothetical protein|nr:T9SS type A sorting domain-containing protein [Dysgonamonadaceae bacterium]
MKKIILLFIIVPFYANAQELITTTGGAEGGVTWSVGEVITATITDVGKTCFLTQGFLQPEHLVSSAIFYPLHDDTPLSVYPNPVTDKLYIRLKNASCDSWKIYDSVGRMLDVGEFSGQEYTIDFSGYTSGYYILVAVSSGERIQSFKIIK